MRDGMVVVSYAFGYYKDFVPVYIYSILRSYPSYSVKIFIADTLTENQNTALEIVRERVSNSFEIVENFFISKHSHFTSATRWLMGKEHIYGFKYAYIGDIDFLITRESPDILTSHLDHAINALHLPYSNIVRHPAKKLSGLQFIIVDEYFGRMQKVIEENRIEPVISIGKGVGTNEVLLYNMVEKGIGLPPPDIEEYRPHHGLHLGLLRHKAGVDELCRSEWERYVSGAIPLVDDIYDEIVSLCSKGEVRRILDVTRTYLKGK